METKKEIACHLCGGKALLRFEELELGGGKVVIRESPYYSCQKCKEEFSTSEQMHELSQSINQAFFFVRPIIHAGRSLAVTFPADLVQFSNLKKGEKICIIPEGKREWRVQITH
ncbi:MAG: YgiT-type zinc finger protein [Candidatus Diapherotrites archaeon]|nr:YgiT-type zinc finger protein [Candidatus Diapherotrites archaeon]